MESVVKEILERCTERGITWNAVAIHRPRMPVKAAAHQLIPLNQIKHLLTRKSKIKKKIRKPKKMLTLNV